VPVPTAWNTFKPDLHSVDSLGSPLVSEMTYYVSSGMLNPTQSLTWLT